MTSKEYMQNELNWLEDLLKKEKEEIKKTALIETTETHIRLTKQVIKDLEMLELLKKCYYSSSIDNAKTLYKTSYGFDNPQDIRKIGEWLNEI